MNKYIVVLLVTLGLTSCTLKDEHYYRSNPKELQKAIKACPDKQPQGLTCQQVNELGNRMNSLAYQLQYNPQGFGGKILTLQQTISNQEMELKKNGTNPALKATIEQNKQELAEFMAVVKWLESPES